MEMKPGYREYTKFVYPDGLDNETQPELATFIVQKAEEMRDYMTTLWNNLPYEMAPVVLDFSAPLMGLYDYP